MSLTRIAHGLNRAQTDPFLHLTAMYLKVFKDRRDKYRRPPSDIAVDTPYLVQVLSELQLGPMQLAHLLSKDKISRSVLSSAVKAGLLGSNWMDDIDEILQIMIGNIIGECLQTVFLYMAILSNSFGSRTTHARRSIGRI